MLYFAGGEFPDGIASNRLLRFDPQLNKWEEMASMAVARSELGKRLATANPAAAEQWVAFLLFVSKCVSD